MIDEDDYGRLRGRMIGILRSEYKIRSEAVLGAMSKIRRHVFIPEKERTSCDPYGDHPCPIGHDQTISQPFIVAYMTERLDLKKGEKVLEVGTGSGYQAAVLAEMGINVFSVEIIPELAAQARKVLDEEGYTNVHILTGDAYKGWQQHSPYDAVIVTCGPEEMPDELVMQLKENGRMILPVGVDVQQLVIVRKKDGKVSRENDILVRFVPMISGKVSK